MEIKKVIEVLDEACHSRQSRDIDEQEAIEEAIDYLRKIENGEYVKVVNAEWQRESSLTNYKCSNCGLRTWDKTNYCFMCGAKMSAEKRSE